MQNSDFSHRSVTIRDIASHLGVSNATVSLALRNHPRISRPTRERVHKAAEELGYRPDPQIGKLMHRLRLKRTPSSQSTIAALTTVEESKELKYLREIIAGAKARAEALGHAFNLIRVPSEATRIPAIERVLATRGVEGLLILPMSTSSNIEAWLDWSRFAVVAASYSVATPEFNRVVPHQFGNALRLCSELAGLGYQRIGLVQSSQQDVSVHHGFSGAVAWQSMLGGTEMVRPFLHPNDSLDRVKAWFRSERPDAIIASGEADCRLIAEALGLTIPGSVGFAVMNRPVEGRFAGMNERPAEIGTAAINLLHPEIISGNLGIPEVPTVTMISGMWVTGPSAAQVDTRPAKL